MYIYIYDICMHRINQCFEYLVPVYVAVYINLLQVRFSCLYLGDDWWLMIDLCSVNYTFTPQCRLPSVMIGDWSVLYITHSPHNAVCHSQGPTNPFPSSNDTFLCQTWRYGGVETVGVVFWIHQSTKRKICQIAQRCWSGAFQLVRSHIHVRQLIHVFNDFW